MIGYILNKTDFINQKIPTIFGAGIGSVILYDLWDKFCCWLGWYPHNLAGLMSVTLLPYHLCYGIYTFNNSCNCSNSYTNFISQRKIRYSIWITVLNQWKKISTAF